MNIITKRGDQGETDIMYGGRVSKTSPTITACGDVDELNTTLGMVRVSGIPEETIQHVDQIQDHLVALMGMVSVPPDQREKYRSKGFPEILPEHISWLETLAERTHIELDVTRDGWARPGACGSVHSAWCDQARAVCRRAERSCWAMDDDSLAVACQFLNRLSDLLWLWAREFSIASDPN